MALTDLEQRMLAFERRWWRRAGAKEQAIRDTFGLSATRYYQLLNRLLEEPEALAHDPVLVSRLRRLRASRAPARPLGEPPVASQERPGSGPVRPPGPRPGLHPRPPSGTGPAGAGGTAPAGG